MFVTTTLPPRGGTQTQSVSIVKTQSDTTLTHMDTDPRRFTGTSPKQTEQALVRHSVPDRTLFRSAHDAGSCPPRCPARKSNQHLSVPFGPGTRRTQILYRCLHIKTMKQFKTGVTNTGTGIDTKSA